MRILTKSALIRSLRIWFILIAAVGMFPSAASPENPARTVYVVPISGTVDPGMAAFVERACEQALKNPDALVVLEIDTFGGMVDSALEIVDTLLKLPPDRTIAFVEKKAISAGALIALSCGSLVMKPATTIGDCAPIAYTSEGPEMMGEKFQSPIRAKFRALAKRNGYPEILSEAMVTPEKGVYSVEINGRRVFMNADDYENLPAGQKAKIKSKKTIVAKGELLTMDSTEALDLGFSKMTSISIPDMISKMGIKKFTIIRIDESWSETMVRFVGTISPILIMVGLAALYMELKAPGFGLPGIIGITCLAIVFFNQYLVGLADYADLLILLFGLALMGVEIFVIPGFGIAGFAAIICIAVGLILSFQNFVIPNPNMPWEADIFTHNIIIVVGSFIVAILLGLLFIRFVLPALSKRRGGGPVLTADLKNAHADSSETARVKVGDKGIARTFLRPSGKAEINDDLFDVVAENEFVEQGTPIRVSAVKGNRIIVSRMTDL